MAMPTLYSDQKLLVSGALKKELLCAMRLAVIELGAEVSAGNPSWASLYQGWPCRSATRALRRTFINDPVAEETAAQKWARSVLASPGFLQLDALPSLEAAWIAQIYLE